METKTILIWGEAGVGKTTFCEKFCQDWGLLVTEMEGKGQELTERQKTELEKLTEEQRSKLNNIGLLLYIVLRDIGSKSVKDIIISKLGFKKLNDSQLSSILERVNESSKFVILMDGFDEISDKDEQVLEVITEPYYHNVHSIITCRPHATRGIVLNVHAEIRLKGFSKAQAKAFVEMYAKIKTREQDQIESFVKQTMSLIESSADLTEMSTNPSMLQLLCLLCWNNGKIGKNRTSVLKDYTSYLLMQYHKKEKKEKLYSTKELCNFYHQNLLDTGKVALMGLRQNQLNLVFSKSEALDIGGDAIFKIGFLTQLPDTDTDSVKVQFTHKTLQEYLAAFYVVNTPGDEGFQLLMEFCSTSQRLMGSQIILEFISNMSTDILGKEIQKKIKHFVSKWDSDDNVDPQRRTSFLISMLEGNETLKFPLPAEININFRYNSFKKPALERFFSMNGEGVRKISLNLDENNRLNVLQNTTIDSLDDLFIYNGLINNTWSREDNEDLRGAMKKMKPGLLSITCYDWELMDEDTIEVILQHVHTLILDECDLEQGHLLSILKAEHHLEVLRVKNSVVEIDAEVIEAVSNLTSNIKLNIIDELADDEIHTQERLRGEITLIHKSPTMKSMSISNCLIDTEIAEAVSRLPDYIQLDLSGSTLRKMDPRLLPGVLSKMPQLTSLNASYNKLTPEAAREFSMSQLQELQLYSCGINDTVCVALMKSLSRHCPLLEKWNLGGNHLTSDEWCHYVQMKQLRELWLSDCGINDTVCVSLMISLSKHCPLLEVLDLGDNNLTSDVWCHHVKMKQLRELWLSDCGINDTVCVSLMISLSRHCLLLEVLYLSNKYTMLHTRRHGYNNNLTSDEWCHHVQMKQLRELWLSKCGINDTVCVSLMISLSRHCPLLKILDLASNNLSLSCMRKIEYPIKYVKNLSWLFLDGNPCMKDRQCREEIKKALQKSNPGLRAGWYKSYF